jgi:putative NIF3 family GTP cyclohydrolase 1 type 2
MYPSSLSPLSSVANRRKFITNTLKIAGGFALLSPQTAFAARKQITVQEVIDTILKEGGLTPLHDTVDTLKSGHANQLVTGIITTMFPTISVIEQAAKQGGNFIIAHEPIYYNHKDEANWVENNSVQKQKQRLLEQHKIAVWRFHDYCHSLKPDAITYGIAKKANWLPYYQSGQMVLTIPPLSLSQLVQHLKSSLDIAHVRIIGNPEQACRRIALLPGAWGGQKQVAVVEEEKPDVLVVGEASEWETVEYVRDARSFGTKTALIVLGHSVSEEPGMEWLADWLRSKLTGTKITHLASGDPFTWM